MYHQLQYCTNQSNLDMEFCSVLIIHHIAPVSLCLLLSNTQLIPPFASSSNIKTESCIKSTPVTSPYQDFKRSMPFASETVKSLSHTLIPLTSVLIAPSLSVPSLLVCPPSCGPE